MTEELLEKLEILKSHNKSGVMFIVIKSFLDSVICIPKGVNAHPYIDEILISLADSSKILEVAEKFGEFRECTNLDLTDHTLRYRIKPSIIIYEWQWELLYDGQLSISAFMTEEEAILNYGKNHDRIKREETKRIKS